MEGFSSSAAGFGPEQLRGWSEELLGEGELGPVISCLHRWILNMIPLLAAFLSPAKQLVQVTLGSGRRGPGSAPALLC